jgi:NAD-dependent DNA ligase
MYRISFQFTADCFSCVQAVLDIDQNVPVVRSTWVGDCQKTSQRLPYSSYLLPVLTGCTLSFTNIPKRRRVQLQKQVEKLGGTVAPDMSKHCSHLVVGDVNIISQKLR